MKTMSQFQIREYAGDKCIALSMGRICDPRTGRSGEVFAIFTYYQGRPQIAFDLTYETFEYEPTARESDDEELSRNRAEEIRDEFTKQQDADDAKE